MPRLYVGNLPDKCSKENLQDLFGPYGDIVGLDVIKNYAFVQYNKDEEAKSAADDLDKTKILGQEIIVQLAKNQSKPNRERRDNRDNDRRPPQRNRGQSNGPPRGGPRDFPNPSGGILGSGPGLGGPVLGGPGGLGPAAIVGPAGLESMNIFSAVNTLAAVEQQKRNKGYLPDIGDIRPPSPGIDRYRRETDRGQERGYPDNDVRVRRDSAPADNAPKPKNASSTTGYVIYERYYIDPSHPLLNGLPLPELPRVSDTRVTDTYVAQEVPTPRPTPYSRNDDRVYKDRSPMAERNDLFRDRERDYRSTGYSSADYYQR